MSYGMANYQSAQPRKPSEANRPASAAPVGQATLPDLDALYQQLLTAVSSAPGPASTVAGSQAAAGMYRQQQRAMAGYNASQLDQQRALEAATRALIERSQFPVANYRTLEEQLLAQAQEGSAPSTTYLYGFA